MVVVVCGLSRGWAFRRTPWGWLGSAGDSDQRADLGWSRRRKGRARLLRCTAPTQLRIVCFGWTRAVVDVNQAGWACVTINADNTSRAWSLVLVAWATMRAHRKAESQSLGHSVNLLSAILLRTPPLRIISALEVSSLLLSPLSGLVPSCPLGLHPSSHVVFLSLICWMQLDGSGKLLVDGVGLFRARAPFPLVRRHTYVLLSICSTLRAGSQCTVIS